MDCAKGVTAVDVRARELLVQLLASWPSWPAERSWYLSSFLPRLIADHNATARDDRERALVMELRSVVDDDEWEALPLLLVRTFGESEAEVFELRVEAERTKQGELAAWRAAAEERERAIAARERAAREAEEAERAEAERQEELREAEQAKAQRDAALREQAEQAAAEASRREARRRETAERVKREAAHREREQRRNAFLDELKARFESNFLEAPAWRNRADTDGLISEADFQAAAVEYVTGWCQTHLLAEDSTPFVPDPEQAAAIATVDRHALVRARAGSGKTATMVARTVFLVRACGVDPSSILMLAFNVAAANEIRERLERLLPGSQPPHVMTFHALAHRLVHPSENLLFDQSDSARPLSRHVQRVINAVLRSSDGQGRVRDVMLAFFQADWSRIVRRGDHLSAEDQVAYRRQLQDETISGDYVKSYGEKLIANTMFTNGIAGNGRTEEVYYRYEPDVRWDGRNYKPDFVIFDTTGPRVVIEYFGMKGDPEYDEQMEDKRAFWSRRDEVFLEYFPRDVARPGFEQRVLSDLAAAGAPLRRLSDQEIWERIKDRAIDRFTEAVTTILNRARQRRWTGQILRKEWERLQIGDGDLDRFVDLAATLLDDYAISLADHAKEDFTGLMWRAVELVRSGTTTFGRGGRDEGDLRAIRHIVVDEFQDFSLMFFELLQAAITLSPEARVMAVGDDWQAINEFAGSTTEYFTNFERGFPDAAQLALSTNRRSASAIVSVGNAVMAGRGSPALSCRAGSSLIREFSAEKFEPSLLERLTFGDYDTTTPALLRLIQSHRAEGRTVAVLSRKRRGRRRVKVDGKQASFGEFGDYGAHLCGLLKVEDPAEVRFSSTHGFKGQEADAVILLDVTGRNYPLIHPTWVLFQVFGDRVRSLDEAERRLFYVGVSRPRTHLDVVTSERDPSPFWRETRNRWPVAPLDWELLPDVSIGPAVKMVEVRVINSDVSDFDESRMQLGRAGFDYSGGAKKRWGRLVSAGDFDVTRLLSAEWARHPGTRIEAWQGGERIFIHFVPGGRAVYPRF